MLTEIGAISRDRDGKFVHYALDVQRRTVLEPSLLRYLHSAPDDRN